MSDHPTLESAIEQLIALGEKDPIEIARKLVHRHGDDWLREVVSSRALDVAADVARYRLGLDRRSAERLPALRTPLASELLLKAKWVPNVGWKRMGDLTADECRAIAVHYRMIANAAGLRARAFVMWADMIEAEGVETLGQVTAPLQLALEEPAA